MKGKSRYLQLLAYIFLIAIFVFAMSIARDCSRLSYQPQEGFSGLDTLDIGLIYGPGSYYIYEDSLGGINQKIAEAYSRDTGIPIKIWPINDAALGFEKLESEAFDILASLPLDNYIKKRFPVSESVFLDRLVLIQLADSISGDTPVNSSLDLNGKEVFVSPGSSAINRLQNLSEEIGGNITITEDPDMSDELICLQVASGRKQLAMVNERVAREIAKNYPLLKFDSTVSFTQFQVWVFNPSDSVEAKKFDVWLDTFSTSPAYREILDNF